MKPDPFERRMIGHALNRPPVMTLHGITILLALVATLICVAIALALVATLIYVAIDLS